MNQSLQNNNAFLEQLLNYLKHESNYMLGYPATRTLDYSPVYPFMDFLINNIGDPFGPPCNFHLNTHEIERQVISWFITILKGKQNSMWGYVTSGGTEGNMYGVYLARELYPTGIVYYSEDTHYSVAKILRLINARSIMIRSQPNGEIDYKDLEETIAVHRDKPPVIFANIGTTMKGAVDDLNKINDILERKAINRYYIHADAALFGMILPFVKDPQPFDFSTNVNSISISGHKFLGIPIPCGIVLGYKDLVDRVASSVEYIGANDATILGSRSGLTPLMFLYAIQIFGKEGIAALVEQCLNNAKYAKLRLDAEGIKSWHNKNSPIVIFPSQREDVLSKWQIAQHKGNAHIITMPHITKKHIDAFVEELIR
jgi:histidine decarboxylase